MKKVALVTGGSRGIGAACVRRLTADGYRVAFCYRKSEAAAKALAEETGALAFPCDVSDPAQVAGMVEAVLAQLGGLDVLVCNAGVAWQGLTQDMTVEDYRRVAGTNLDGVFYCCQAALKPMLRQKSGRIVTLSSMWGQVGGSCEVAYSAAKAGVIGLTKALAKEVALSGITVNCVAPGVIDTDMVKPLGAQTLSDLAAEIPLGRLGTAEEVAGCVSFLCSEEGSYLTGQILAPNGGLVM